jgi:hypothetical protein
MHELPDEYLADALPVAKKIAAAQGVENYNILQVCLKEASSSPVTLALQLTVVMIEQWAHRASGAINRHQHTQFSQKLIK